LQRIEPLTLTRTGTLAGALDQAAPFLPELLMSRQSLDHTRRVAALFPSDAVDFFGFEARLGEVASTSTDCALNLSPAGARALARDAIGPDTELWRRIGRFYRLWEETHRDPFADAPATWLEFDASAAEPSPNLLFGYWPDDEQADRPWQWMQDTVFPMLFGGNYSAPLRDSLDRCFHACPPGTVDFQIGLMLSRPIQAVRLCIFDLPMDALPAYLDAIGWTGDRAGLERLVAAFRPYCDFVGLHFDVAAQVFPHIGIEPNFRSGSWSRQPHREPRWQGLWTALAQAGLLSEAKRDALLGWTGHQQVILDDVPTLLLRGLSHIKVVQAGDGSATAKAYFGIALREAAQP
jgi:hypothetical protein